MKYYNKIMKHYNKIKNFILASLVGFIYYKYIVPSTPALTKLLAISFMITLVMWALDSLDAKKKAKVRERREKSQEMTKSA